MSTVRVETFIQEFVEELRHNNAAIFAGAGLSVAAGFVDWKELLRNLAKQLDLDVDREHDLARIAQYNINHYGDNRGDLNTAILDKFSRAATTINENHRILTRLPIDTFWTTNYDRCIEDALRQAGKHPDVKHSAAQLPHTVHGRDAVVYKMHGDVDLPQEAVLAKADYERYHVSRGDFLTTLAGDLLSRTFLFIGFSFSDPNLDYVLGRLYTRHQGNQRKHYCFVRNEKAHPQDKDGDLAYRLVRQQHFIRDLGRYNIRAVMVDEYDQITEILRHVESRYKSRTIFVSGAAHDYGPVGEQAVLQFVHQLGTQMVARDFRMVTGLGLGIGSTLLDGALQQIYRVQRTSLRDQVIIRPFPQSAAAQQLWSDYRRDMLSYAGMAIFMYGNKLAGSPPEVSPSNGITEEFELAVQTGVKVLPLGFTGFVARQLYDRVVAEFGRYYPKATPSFQKNFALLGDDQRSLDEQLTTLMDALTELQSQ